MVTASSTGQVESEADDLGTAHGYNEEVVYIL